MRSSRVFLVMAALALATAMSVLPTQVASAQSPSTSVLVPANGATVSGARVILDAGASAGVTQVKFEVSGGPASLNDQVVATAVPTYYGWIAEWNSTTVANGSYTLQSVATEGGLSATSTAISITVNNPPPSVSIVLPASGATVSGTVVLDALASPGVNSVDFVLEGTSYPPTFTDLGNATPTIYGWLLEFPSTLVPNETPPIYASATYANGERGVSGIPSFVVANPAPTMVVPANGATLHGTQVLDCAIPPYTGAPVSFVANGGGSVGDATQTYYGWLYDWNTTTAPNGVYAISCSATYAYDGSGHGASISVTVSN